MLLVPGFYELISILWSPVWVTVILVMDDHQKCVIESKKLGVLINIMYQLVLSKGFFIVSNKE